MIRSSQAAAILLFLFLISCGKVPITGRKQVNLLPETELVAMSLQQYSMFLKESPPVTGTSDAEMVKRVGMKISNAVQIVLKQTGDLERVSGYKWEYNLVNEKEPNAWCLPGGKIVVYTGLLPITQTEAGLAAVMGHEVAHAVARHGNERMSQGLVAEMGGLALSVAVADKPAETQNLFLNAYGIGATVGALLPFSRTHESEADKMGAVFMAAAGYDPNEAVRLWERMKKMTQGNDIPEFLSTHPSDDTRINDLKAWLPEAMKYYKP
jgi:predicted Zn-dependent protease